ncbi:ElyC/SanA/YdcF family protein [Chenggangzhangella methanolivorans]|uniref:YdcF family protein n=2 Tax=Chenggangzhangella methanolivorans TaxID=1437009 RepID=A0A9E6RDF0_9HYPH|nr:ElyC/SanA/YdcF family protein [Chenggangzhangella methanolivorans]QZO01273.1 YdcF family protein [Chenggangzhangella methanolivorans]
MEPNSRTTQENAINVAAILRAQGLRSAKLVTHWFHARRAIAAFRAAAPEVAFTAASVTPEGSPRWRLGWSSEPQATLSEYVKIVWYAIAHGVFVRLTAEPLGPPA